MAANVGYLTSKVTNIFNKPVDIKFGKFEPNELYGNLANFKTPSEIPNSVYPEHLSSSFLIKKGSSAFDESKKIDKSILDSHWNDHLSINRSENYKENVRKVPSFTVKLKHGEIFEVEPLKNTFEVLNKKFKGVESAARNNILRYYKGDLNDTDKFDAFSSGFMNFKGKITPVIIQKTGFEEKISKEGVENKHLVKVLHGSNLKLFKSRNYFFDEHMVGDHLKNLTKSGSHIKIENEERSDDIDNLLEKTRVKLASKYNLEADDEIFPFTMHAYNKVNDPSLSNNLEDRRNISLVWRYGKKYKDITTYHTAFTDSESNDVSHMIPLSDKESYGKSGIFNERKSTLQLRGVVHMYNKMLSMNDEVKEEGEEATRQFGVESNKGFNRAVFFGSSMASAYASNSLIGKGANRQQNNNNNRPRNNRINPNFNEDDFTVHIPGGDQGASAILGVIGSTASTVGSIGLLVPALTHAATSLYRGHQYWSKKHNLEVEAKQTLPFAGVLTKSFLNSMDEEVSNPDNKSSDPRAQRNSETIVALLKNSFDTGTPLDINQVHMLTRDTEKRTTDPNKHKYYDSNYQSKINFDGYHDKHQNDTSTGHGVAQMGSRKNKVHNTVYKSGFDIQQKVSNAGSTAFTHNLKIGTKRKRQ